MSTSALEVEGFLYPSQQLAQELMTKLKLRPEVWIEFNYETLDVRLRGGETATVIMGDTATYGGLLMARIVALDQHPILKQCADTDLRRWLGQSAQVCINHCRMIVDDYNCGRLFWSALGSKEKYEEIIEVCQKFQTDLFTKPASGAKERK